MTLATGLLFLAGVFASADTPVPAASAPSQCTKPLDIAVHPKGQFAWRYESYTIETLVEQINLEKQRFDCLKLMDVTKHQADRNAINDFFKKGLTASGSGPFAIEWRDYARPDAATMREREKQWETTRVDMFKSMSEKCKTPTYVKVLDSGDYVFEEKTYNPYDFLGAVNNHEPKIGCLKFQGKREDPKLGNRLLWLMNKVPGTVVSWMPDPKLLCKAEGEGQAAIESEDACKSLPASEFAPLTVAEFRQLQAETSSTLGCVFGYQVKNRGFLGKISDERIHRKLAKAGRLPALKSDVETYFPGLQPAGADRNGARGDFGEVSALSKALLNRWNTSERLADALLAKALYTKHMAAGADETCKPTENFIQLLEKYRPDKRP